MYYKYKHIYNFSSTGPYGVPAAYERSFRWKLSQFRYLCQSNAISSHIKITVSRQTLFEDSYHQIMRSAAYEMRKRLYIVFRGEEGLDYGGVSRYIAYSLLKQFNTSIII